MAFGPFPSDGFFGSGTYRNFDGVLAMYHDQGLTPFKLEAGADGVNFTAGLKYVRTSPGHGTGYDIAGKGVADATSMRHAIYEACDIYRRRKTYLRSKMNPLRKQYVERGADKTIDLSKEPEPEI
jgi:4-hydroxythreonine-4-phosphate dehydrogenase